MKSIRSRTVLVFGCILTTIYLTLITTPSTSGLICYSCMSQKSVLPFYPRHYKGCRQGKLLPESIVEDCNLYNTLDEETKMPLNVTSSCSRRKEGIDGTTSCMILHAFQDEDKYTITVRSCVWTRHLLKEERCLSSDKYGILGVACFCYTDKCNGDFVKEEYEEGLGDGEIARLAMNKRTEAATAATGQIILGDVTSILVLLFGALAMFYFKL